MSAADAYDRVVERERQHHRYRRSRRSWRILTVHAWVFLAVHLAMIASWGVQQVMFDHSHPLWWLPSLVGWGVGLGLHAALVRRYRGPRPGGRVG